MYAWIKEPIKQSIVSSFPEPERTIETAVEGPVAAEVMLETEVPKVREVQSQIVEEVQPNVISVEDVPQIKGSVSELEEELTFEELTVAEEMFTELGNLSDIPQKEVDECCEREDDSEYPTLAESILGRRHD